LFHTPLEFGSKFLGLSFLAGATTASFYGWLPLYLPELFPTRIRATGQGFAYNFGRVLAAAGTLAAGQLLNYFHGDFARTGAVTCLVYLVGLVLIWFCPETKGRPLPE
jgi:MFS family permease